jgi:peptidoglycan hydrolase-like protein with peptidoglycan-binding domain/S1-C subfamily serine protease
MTWTLRKTVTLLIGATFLTVALAPEAEAQRRRRAVGVGVGVAIGAGVIGAAIGSAIANQHRQRPKRPAKKSRQQPAEERHSASDQDQASERVNVSMLAQYSLYALDFYPGPMSGRMTKETAIAIAKWQQKNQFEVTGRLTPQQFEKLRGVIVSIQQMLDRLNYDPGPSDGNVTRRLRESVQRFQTKIGVRADSYLTAKELSVLIALDNERATNIAIDRVFDKIASAAARQSPAGGGSTATAVAEAPGFRSVCRETVAASTFSMGIPGAGSTDRPEQFCLVRAQAIEEGNGIFKKLAARVKTITPELVRAECARFAESKRQEIAALHSDEPGAITAQLAKAMPTNTRQREIAIGNAKVCLGFGYSDDAPEVALGSTLFLLGLGETGYAELIAGHFAHGVGAPKDILKAVAWLEFTAHELESGKMAVVKGNLAERAKLLRQVSANLKNAPDSKGPSIGPQFSLAAVEPQKSPPRDPDLPPYVPHLQDNVVYLFTGSAAGTGFFIAPNLILTNDHVVGKATRVLVASKALPLNVQRGKVLYRGRTGGASDKLGIDAAIVEVEGYRHPTFLKFASDKPAVTSFIAVGGFPGLSLAKDRGNEDFFKVISQGDLPTAEQLPHLTISSGNVQSYFPDKVSGRERMQHSAATAKGSSGSPIVNSCGEIVALLDSGSVQSLGEVVDRGYVEGTTFIWTYTAAEVMKFLRSVKVEVQSASDRCRVAEAGRPR